MMPASILTGFMVAVLMNEALYEGFGMRFVPAISLAGAIGISVGAFLMVLIGILKTLKGKA